MRKNPVGVYVGKGKMATHGLVKVKIDEPVEKGDLLTWDDPNETFRIDMKIKNGPEAFKGSITGNKTACRRFLESLIEAYL